MLTFVLLTNGGMGLGDVKLAALVGLMVGFPNVLPAIVLSWIMGGLIAFAIIRIKKIARGDMPFAPAISIATVTTLCWQLGR